MAFVIVFMISGLIVWWPFWSYSLVKWKIWSYKNVDDFNLFVRLALERALIYPENHFYSRFEFCSAKDKKLLKELYAYRKKVKGNNFLLEKYNSKTVFIRSGILRLFDNRPLLEISTDNIWFRDIGFIEWSKITTIIAKTSGGKYPSFWIEFRLRNEKSIRTYKLTNMFGTFLKLEYYIETYKKLATTKAKFHGR